MRHAPILALLLLWVGAAQAAPEGTRQLGLAQGLVANSPVQVYLRAGEQLRLCSSDDGRTEDDVFVNLREPDCMGRRCTDRDGTRVPLDLFPRRDNPIAASRVGSQILLAPPSPVVCRDDSGCPRGHACHDPRDGEPQRAGGANGICVLALAVNEEGGHCVAAQPEGERRWRTVTADETGHHTLRFVGEPATRGGDIASTRFFEVDVVDAPTGRLNAEVWHLHAHEAANSTSADFYVDADGRVFVLDLEDLAGFIYRVQASRMGIDDFPRRSWCLYGDPVAEECAPRAAGQASHSRAADYRVYLAYPDPAPVAPPAPRITDAEFNDSLGCTSISPDGDGVQDDGVFTFESNVDGTYLIIIDTDRDEALNPERDRVLFGAARRGENSVRWDGRDAAGRPVPAGRYRFLIRLNASEAHFPFSDIEDNMDGLVVWEQPGRAAPRRALPMYWDDRAVRSSDDLIELGFADALTGGAAGSTVPPARHQRRRWTQDTTPDNRDRPVIFDTWVFGAQAETGTVGCARCRDQVGFITVGRDEAPGARELCNGLDDDCDGLIDEDADPGEACDTGRPGVCADGETVCVEGEVVCHALAAPSAETCNGLDDDCDADLDEDLPLQNEACDTGEEGLCGPGRLGCVAGGVGCLPEVARDQETCDGADEDCDGAIDEETRGEGEACETGLAGACAMGTQVCDDARFDCAPSVEPTPETCDGVDEDCDGEVDEDAPGAGEACESGMPGQCAEGLVACARGGLECEPIEQPTSELCDGADNDCDGAVDEGLPGVGEACETGLGGACGEGVLGCGPEGLECQPVGAREACNGEDDDCDGAIDEGALGADEPCEAGGMGRCGAGVSVCQDGELVCEPDLLPVAEACNGEDDDCDGEIDDEALCASGEGCHEGRCVLTCTNHECPDDLRCEMGFCVDLCAEVTCFDGKTCVSGQCLDFDDPAMAAPRRGGDDIQTVEGEGSAGCACHFAATPPAPVAMLLLVLVALRPRRRR